ncbi:hypothetical protein E4L96_08570 [Massilia arenosa]|uniref:Uncharacterized protein n=1 Tax=Zemynaea arenosa TaxID=2561931 RepID=A0A4Y9SIB1_9BURK|nr:hypothetical protein [Massilia arenosa]TFW21759.1 hypothetical protein E4L96_08570 [Massilia arenosa]
MTYVAMRPVNLTAVLHLDLELHLWNTGHNMKPDEFVADLVSRWLSADKARIAALSESKKGRIRFPGHEHGPPAARCRE